MAEDAKIIIDVDVETKKVEKELDRVLNEYTKKKIELDLQLRSQANIKKQLVELQILMNKLKTPTPEMYEQFDKLSNSLKNSVSNAFIQGFGLKKGAIASSVAHDSHNIIVIGSDSKYMAEAVNKIIDDMGGLAVVGEDFNYSLPMPIVGLMSNEDAFEVAEKIDILHEKTGELGCKLDSPFMTMAFMALLVIPSLKISDKGLFDGDKFEFIDVIN